MERIIRLNAVETSNQARSSEMNLHYLHPTQNLMTGMVSINTSTLISVTTALVETPSNSDSDTATTNQTAIINTGNWSTSLQGMLDHPPSAIPQLVLFGSVAFFAIVMAWVWGGKIEEVNYIQGKLLSLGEVYKLHPQSLGKILNIAVKEGQQVKAGQVVVELDEEQASQTALARTILRNLLVSATASQIEGDDIKRYKPIEPLLVESQKLLKQHSDITVAPKRLDTLQAQLTEGVISRNFIFQADVNTVRNTKSRDKTQEAITKIKQLQIELAHGSAEHRLILLEAQRQIQHLAVEMTQLQTKIAETKTLLNSAKAKLKRRFLHAPVDGIVSLLNIHSTGIVVQPGQTIVEITPQNAPLILVAVLPKKKIGFIKKGMLLKIQLDTDVNKHNLDKHSGIIPGKVISIFPEEKADKRLGLFYRVEVALQQNYATNNQTIKFQAGQTVTAKIIYHRPIVDMFLKLIK
jgi:hemolysin D